MRQKINKGDKFLCIKDFIMQDGTTAFKKGVVYTSENNNCLTNSWGTKEHYMHECDDFSDYFKTPIADSKVLLQRILDLKNEH